MNDDMGMSCLSTEICNTFALQRNVLDGGFKKNHYAPYSPVIANGALINGFSRTLFLAQILRKQPQSFL